MDKYSTQFIASVPKELEPESTMNIEHFTTACEMHFNAEHRIIAPLVGTEFTAKRNKVKRPRSMQYSRKTSTRREIRLDEVVAG